MRDCVDGMECRQVFGTPAFRVDLVDSAINFKPTIVSRGFHGSPFFSFPRPNKGGSFAQVKIVGPIVEFDFTTRNDDVRPLSSTPCTIFLTLACYFYLGPGRSTIQHFFARRTYLRERNYHRQWIIPYPGASAQGHWEPDQEGGLRVVVEPSCRRAGSSVSQ